MNDAVLLNRRGDVFDITLNTPDNGNLVTEAMGASIVDALANLAPGTKLVRVTGNGSDFCRGRQSPPLDRATASAQQFRQNIAEGPLRLYGAFRDCRVPILGTIQGQALGVGCALAGLSDIAIASDDSVFSIPELNHGIPPMLVISALADRLPPQNLSFLVLSRRRIMAERALAIGLVSDVVPADELSSTADEIEASILECTALALGAVKDYMRAASRLEPAARNGFASSLIATVLSSQHRP